MKNKRKLSKLSKKQKRDVRKQRGIASGNFSIFAGIGSIFGPRHDMIPIHSWVDFNKIYAGKDIPSIVIDTEKGLIDNKPFIHLGSSPDKHPKAIHPSVLSDIKFDTERGVTQ